MLRCSRCQHIFPAPHEAPPSGDPVRAASRSPRQENLSFAFGEEGEPAPESDAVGNAWEKEFLLTESEDEESDTLAPRFTAGALEDRADDEREDTDSRRMNVRPVFIFLIFVVAGYALFARTLYANPEWANQLVGQLPFSMTERPLDDDVRLLNVTGHHDRLKNGEDVLLVTGHVLNRASAALDNVQIRVRAFDAQDHKIGEKVVFCGHLAPSRLHDLTVRELTILGGIPTQRFAILPGDESPFFAVLGDLPAVAVEFSAGLIAARRKS